MFQHPSIQLVNHIINQIVDTALNVIHQSYLKTKLTTYLNKNNINLINMLAEDQIKHFDHNLSRTTQNIDKQIEKPIDQAWASKIIRTKKINIKMQTSTFVDILTPDSPSSKLLKKNSSRIYNIVNNNKFLKKQQSAYMSEIPNNNLQKQTKLKPISSTLIPVNIQNFAQDDPQQTIQQRLRNQKNRQIQLQINTQKAIKQQQYKKQTQQISIRKEIQKLRAKKLQYTYDFDGKLIVCNPKKENYTKKQQYLHDGIIPATTPKVKIIDQIQVNGGNVTNSQQKFNLNNTIKIDKQTKNNFLTAIPNSTKTSYIKKQSQNNFKQKQFQYNNNNARQLTNAGIIQLIQGSIIKQQGQNVIYGGRSSRSNSRQQFMKRLAEGDGFLSYFQRQNPENKKQFDQYNNEKSQKQRIGEDITPVSETTSDTNINIKKNVEKFKNMRKTSTPLSFRSNRNRQQGTGNIVSYFPFKIYDKSYHLKLNNLSKGSRKYLDDKYNSIDIIKKTVRRQNNNKMTITSRTALLNLINEKDNVI